MEKIELFFKKTLNRNNFTHDIFLEDKEGNIVYQEKNAEYDIQTNKSTQQLQLLALKLREHFSELPAFRKDFISYLQKNKYDESAIKDLEENLYNSFLIKINVNNFY